METIPFNEDAVKEYLDKCIQFWRAKRGGLDNDMAIYYVDAYQSVRISLFGELLPLDK